MNLSKPIRRRDPKYLAWIRTRPCTIQPCDSKSIHAHHVRVEGHGGIGTKPDDSRAIPLCPLTHRSYHDIGRNDFERWFQIELETEIKRLNALYLREFPKVKQRVPRETVAVHLKHCLTCSRSVKRCKARKRI